MSSDADFAAPAVGLPKTKSVSLCKKAGNRLQCYEYFLLIRMKMKFYLALHAKKAYTSV